MFWSKQLRKEVAALDASEVVSRVGELNAGFHQRHQLVKNRSCLPCSWFATRECFFHAYDKEYRELPKQLHDSYHLVYAELAFFVDDGIGKEFDLALGIAAKCRNERMQKLGIAEDEQHCRRFIASFAVKAQERKEIWEHLALEVTCPRRHLVLLAETLTFCAAQYRSMYDEWVAYANLLSFTKKKEA
ncbi:MAG: hypothetical protein PHE83_08130 [Opitutaceae bacterium]|nr:hypothetical protein [Opitutaceae bacterium]